MPVAVVESISLIMAPSHMHGIRCTPDPIFGDEPWDREMPIQDRFKVKYLKAAPYIVHACGLDPNVATVEDMDRRNARLKCLPCNDSYIRNWKGSVRLSVDRVERSVTEHGMPNDSSTSIWMQSRLRSYLLLRNPFRNRRGACCATLVLETLSHKTPQCVTSSTAWKEMTSKKVFTTLL
ncbi:hypothetical protein HD554DRAFT_2079531 [Boletus coccyginus]|nr:hypothetical protein HD554DRAFT_2079531 [Boletus coccyginus]